MGEDLVFYFEGEEEEGGDHGGDGDGEVCLGCR